MLGEPLLDIEPLVRFPKASNGELFDALSKSSGENKPENEDMSSPI